MLRPSSKQFTVDFSNHRRFKLNHVSNTVTFLIVRCICRMYLMTTDLWFVGGKEDHITAAKRLNRPVSGRETTVWTGDPSWECSTSIMIWVRNSPEGVLSYMVYTRRCRWIRVSRGRLTLAHGLECGFWPLRIELGIYFPSDSFLIRVLTCPHRVFHSNPKSAHNEN